MIRLANNNDIERFRAIHKKFFEQEFSFPDFSNFFDTFTNDTCIGGIRPIIECVAVTDKDLPIRDRKIALLELMQAVMVATKRAGHHEMHAFVQDEKWKQILKNYGFRSCKGEALVVEV